MIACLLPSGAALAKNPCKEDREKFCADVKAAGGKVAECLGKRINELSAECKEKLAEKGKVEEQSGDKPADAPAEAAAPGSAETQAE
jgi:hypothetical protein